MEYPRVHTRSWTRAEYDRLIEVGFFDEDEPIELLGGLLVVREPQYSPHATAVRLAEEALRRVFGAGWDVRPGLPVALDDDSEPEPDVCVVAGNPRTYRDAHPARPVLIVEVALSSLGVDRRVKGSLYARAAIRDYWIVNLPERQVEVHRHPVADTGAAHGWRYADVEMAGAAATVSPLAAPAAVIAVADLLP
jgi:Uma2 family endonuclease